MTRQRSNTPVIPGNGLLQQYIRPSVVSAQVPLTVEKRSAGAGAGITKKSIGDDRIRSRVAVILAWPGPTAVTIPWSTVATDGSLVLQEAASPAEADPPTIVSVSVRVMPVKTTLVSGQTLMAETGNGGENPLAEKKIFGTRSTSVHTTTLWATLGHGPRVHVTAAFPS